MKLKVIDDRRTDPPWYGGGLRFTCTQCGNCCTGGPGHVWISRTEIQRLAQHLKLTPRQVIARYCRRVGEKFSLREHRNAHGQYDCIFLKEEDAPVGGNGQQIVFKRRICTIYEVRPLQCRTWPFWEANLASPAAWRRASLRCHGMNNGPRLFTRQQIESLRDATDWPLSSP